MKTLEQLTKKQLIELIIKIRPKADAYERVCKELGVENDILPIVKELDSYKKKIEETLKRKEETLDELMKTEKITYNFAALEDIYKYINETKVQINILKFLLTYK